MSKIRALAELGRVSNAPTCVSNVLVGAALGAGGAALAWPPVVASAVAVVLLYIGGMALNDVADVKYDRRVRPERPIPSGRVGLGEAWIFVIVCFAAGLAFLVPWGWPPVAFGVSLLVSIAGYNFLNKRWPGAIVLMGTCRGLIYPLAAAALAWPIPLVPAVVLGVTLTLYTIGLTVVARSEATDVMDARRWISVALPLLVVAPWLRIHPPRWGWALAAGALTVLWLSRAVRAVFQRPPATIRAVLTWIVGFGLVDALFLTLLGRVELAGIAVALAVFTAWGHRRILGT